MQLSLEQTSIYSYTGIWGFMEGENWLFFFLIINTIHIVYLNRLFVLSLSYIWFIVLSKKHSI